MSGLFLSGFAREAVDLASHLQSVNACPICDSRGLNERGPVALICSYPALRTQLMECRQCRHWFVTPMPSQEVLTSLYAQNSAFVVDQGWQGRKKNLTIPERYVIARESRRARRRGNYLEIGVGAGLLFDHFQSRGYQCSGVEPGPWGRSRPGLVRAVEELNDDDYDVAVLADVLEHLRDPRAMVHFVGQRMKSGTLYACFPNNQSLRARLAARKWRMVRPFGHLHFFSKSSLTVMLASNGFRLRDLRRTDLAGGPLRSLVWPPREAIMRIFMLPTQRFWGDQWIVQAEKRP